MKVRTKYAVTVLSPLPTLIDGEFEVVGESADDYVIESPNGNRVRLYKGDCELIDTAEAGVVYSEGTASYACCGAPYGKPHAADCAALTDTADDEEYAAEEDYVGCGYRIRVDPDWLKCHDAEVRERCAKIALAEIVRPIQVEGDGAWNDACEYIAAAIRETE